MKTLALLLVVTLVVAAAASSSSSKSLCDNDPDAYSPCYCDETNGAGRFITCSGVATAQEVTNAFSRSSVRDYAFLTLAGSSFTAIPSNVIGSSRVQQIQVRCQGKQLTSIDTNAFRASAAYTTSFGLDNCAVDPFNFAFTFLSGFTALTELTVTRTPLLNLNNFPFLPALRTINLQQVDFFQGWYPNQPNSLLENVVVRNMADDSMVVTILDSLVFYQSTLRTVNFEGTQLDAIPPQMRLLTGLTEVRLGNNSITALKAGSLSTTAKLVYLGLEKNQLSDLSLEAGAFASDFSQTFIDLSGNRFARLPYATFYPLLSSMTNGSLQLQNPAESVSGNLFNCDCLLSWLIKDCRSLLPRVLNGYCTNGTRFDQLNPAGTPIAGCPVQCTESGNTDSLTTL